MGHGSSRPPSYEQTDHRHRKNALSIVTGANSGIGTEVATGLMEQGCTVILGCRTMDKCHATKRELDARGLAGSCECIAPLELSEMDSVRGFVEKFEQRAGRDGQLLLLVNNAGYMGGRPNDSTSLFHGHRHRHKHCRYYVLEADPHIKPNYLGPYLLTRSLLHRLGSGSRVVTVASQAHLRAPHLEVSSEGIEGLPNNWYSQYARSKLLNVLMTVQLEKELQLRNIPATCYSVSPGRVNTKIFSNVPWPLDLGLKAIAGLFFKTPREGAQTILHAAMAKDLEGRSVPYLHEFRPAPVNAQVLDEALAKRLWDVSEALVGPPGVHDRPPLFARRSGKGAGKGAAGVEHKSSGGGGAAGTGPEPGRGPAEIKTRAQTRRGFNAESDSVL